MLLNRPSRTLLEPPKTPGTSLGSRTIFSRPLLTYLDLVRAPEDRPRPFGYCPWGGSAPEDPPHVHRVERVRILPLVPGGAPPPPDTPHVHKLEHVRILPVVPGGGSAPSRPCPCTHCRMRTHFTIACRLTPDFLCYIARWRIRAQRIWYMTVGH